jgi:hypothetical protein
LYFYFNGARGPGCPGHGFTAGRKYLE